MRWMIVLLAACYTEPTHPPAPDRSAECRRLCIKDCVPGGTEPRFAWCYRTCDNACRCDSPASCACQNERVEYGRPVSPPCAVLVHEQFHLMPPDIDNPPPHPF